MPTRISDTKAEFNGKTYYRLGGPGGYFKNDGKSLHRAVWTYYNGPIPEGHHIHHKDHNKENNDLSNLECIQGSAHMSMHGKENMNGRGYPKACLDAAAEWHRSEEGRKWHKERTLKPKEKTLKPCVQCGTEILTYKCLTCSPACKKRLAKGLTGGPSRRNTKGSKK